jgi:hypothetical protein
MNDIFPPFLTLNRSFNPHSDRRLPPVQPNASLAHRRGSMLDRSIADGLAAPLR